MERLLISIVPFVISLCLEILSPFFSSYTKDIIRSDAERYDIYDNLTDNYIEFADHAFSQLQMIYTYLLTSASGLVALYFNRGYFWLFLLLLAGQVVLGWWIYIDDPHKRNREPFLIFGRSRETIFGALLNLSYIISLSLIDLNYLG